MSENVFRIKKCYSYRCISMREKESEKRRSLVHGVRVPVCDRTCDRNGYRREKDTRAKVLRLND